MFDIQARALTEAFDSAPEILFIAAAVNSKNGQASVEDVAAAGG